MEIANYITPPANANAVNQGQIDVMISNMQNTTEFHNFTNIDTSHHSGIFNASVSESNGLRMSIRIYRIARKFDGELNLVVGVDTAKLKSTNIIINAL